MNPRMFYMPGNIGMRSVPNMMSTMPMYRMANSAPRGMGLFSRISNGIRSVNWSGLLNNANKTLDVVNQAIPLVRQAGPMVNNMRSMFKVAKAFGSETSNINRNNQRNINNNYNENYSNNNYNNSNMKEQKKEEQNDSIPNFFI